MSMINCLTLSIVFFSRCDSTPSRSFAKDSSSSGNTVVLHHQLDLTADSQPYHRQPPPTSQGRLTAGMLRSILQSLKSLTKLKASMMLPFQRLGPDCSNPLLQSSAVGHPHQPKSHRKASFHDKVTRQFETARELASIS